jgi:hypothetical protein
MNRQEHIVGRDTRREKTSCRVLRYGFLYSRVDAESCPVPSHQQKRVGPNPEKLFPFPLNNRNNFLSGLGYPVIPARMFLRCQALNESLFGKFNHDSADRRAIHNQLFGEIRW